MQATKTFTILSVDDDKAELKLLDLLLHAEGYNTLQAACGSDGLQMAVAHSPDLILLDLLMPGMDGLELTSLLKANPATEHIPLIMLTAINDRSTRLRALEAGANDFLTKPVDRAELIVRVRNMLRIKHCSDQTAAALSALEKEVQQHKQSLNLLREHDATLARFKYTLDHTRDGVFIFDPVTLRFNYVNHGAMQQVGYSEAELMHMTPLDIKPDFNTLQFRAMLQSLLDGSQPSSAFETLHRHKDGHQVPVEIVLQYVKQDDQDSNFIAFSRDISERRTAEREIHNLAFYDGLTQLPNRRMFGDRLNQAMAINKRSGEYGAVMFLDLDNFKPLNDAHGHLVGDLLLIEVAMRLKSCVREMDTVARFGGDEFVVMLCELNSSHSESCLQASIVAEKIRSALAEPYLLKVCQEGQAVVTVEHHCTASIGVALFKGADDCQINILKWADNAMYQAKDAGRNRVKFYEVGQNKA